MTNENGSSFGMGRFFVDGCERQAALVVLLLMNFSDRIQRNRRFRRVIVLAALAVAAAISLPHAVSGQTREAESKRVYAAVFDVLLHQGGESAGTVVLKDSTAWETSNAVWNGRLIQPHASEIDEDAIRDFGSRAVPPIALDASFFSYSKPIRFITNHDAFVLDSVGQKVGPAPSMYENRFSNWAYGFASRYPRAWGVTSVSPVGFNRTRNQALVFVKHFCGGSCYHNETFFLRKTGDAWNVAERIPFQNQDGLGPGELRYLGKNPQYLLRVRRTQDSTRRAIADSIARDKLPRRIHGAALNRAGNVPVANAQVFLQHHATVDNQEELKAAEILLRAVADSSGRFEFLDPPTGITTLILECPGSEFSQSIGLDMQVAYVAQAADTMVNLVAFNIGPCWKSHRYFPIEPGWLESAEARNAIVPTREESDVMATVISHERSNRNGSRFVAIQSHTITRCRFNRRCGSLQFDRMVHDHGIDSSTIVAFKNRASKSEVLNPAFARRIGLQVMTRDEMHYLATSALRASPQSTPAEDSARFWPGFRQLHGSGSGIISISSVGFNRARSEALVEVRVDSTGPQWSDYSRMMLLRESGKKWRVVNDNVGGAGVQATSGNWEHGKCVAVRSPQTISRAAVNSLLGEFDLTLVDAGEGRKTTMRVRIERNLPPRWSPGPSSTSKPLAPLPRSYEVIAAGGGADISKTEDLSITWIPRNIIRDPMLIRLDGFYQNLKISKVTNSGFYGSYVDGVFGDSGFGYFCAQRVSQH
jgi:hypothetical protein